MKRPLMHPAYYEALRSEEIEYPLGTQREEVGSPDEEEQDVSPDEMKALRAAKVRFFASGIGVGVLAVSLLWLPTRTRSFPSEAVLPSTLAPNGAATEPQGGLTKLESEMELMKKIVAGLVDTVHGLSRTREVSGVNAELTETFPFPVKVTTGKAHLRKEADRLAPSLLEVTKDTSLMAFAGTDKWLKVSTPRGEDAWISRSVVVAQRG